MIVENIDEKISAISKMFRQLFNVVLRPIITKINPSPLPIDCELNIDKRQMPSPTVDGIISSKMEI